MKNILIALSFIIATTSLYGQNALELTFKKYKNNEEVTSLTFDDKIMTYLKNKDQEWKTSIDKVEILLFQPEEDFSASDIHKIEEALNSDAYELLVNAKSKDGKAKIYGLPNGDDSLHALYAQVYSEMANIYFMLKGDIYYEELGEMGLNFQGADVFKQFSDKHEEFEQKKQESK